MAYLYTNKNNIKVDKGGRLLIIDDNKSVLDSLELLLKYRFEEVIAISNPNMITSILGKKDIDVVLLDMNFSAGQNTGNEGIYWMRRIRKLNPDISIIPITAYGDVEKAVATMKEGAIDFILKPWDNNKLLATLQVALLLKKSKDELKILHKKEEFLKEDKDQSYGHLLWKSDSMQEVYNTIKKVAATDANILLLGENGTGKELAAYMIHKLSKRKKEVFVRVDLGALSESLFESELFGHRKGAFTDAKTDRTGKMESAKDGTLFLDEIANLSLPTQSKLLTAIQRKSIVPLGSNKEQSVNFRLICATNRNLAELMSKKLFREDLLYRINTIVIEMPPLRKRKEDIEFLAMHFLNNFKEKYSKPKLMIDETGIHRLKDYHWPGNVRELKHTIEKAVILSDSDILTEKNFQLRTLEFKSNVNISPISLEDAEKIVISNALKNNKGNISNTARELKIGRQTLYRKIEKFQLKY